MSYQTYQKAHSLAEFLVDNPQVSTATAFAVPPHGGRVYSREFTASDAGVDDAADGIDPHAEYREFGVEFRTGQTGLTPTLLDMLREAGFDRIQNSTQQTGEFRVYVG